MMINNGKPTNKECMACFHKLGTRVKMYAVDVTTKDDLPGVPALGGIIPAPSQMIDLT